MADIDLAQQDSPAPVKSDYLIATFPPDGSIATDPEMQSVEDLSYSLPPATETVIGGVRNVSADEAAEIQGGSYRAWSASMITSLVGAWRSLVTPDEAEAGLSSDARFWSPQRVLQAIQANRNPQAFVGVSEANGELSFARQSGADPVDVSIAGAGGAFELELIGSRAAVTLGATFVGTGIIPPELDPDEAFYLRIAVPEDAEPPHYYLMRGATFNDLTVAAVGGAPSSNYWSRALTTSGSQVQVQKTASGELLIASADAGGSAGWVEAYSVSVGAGGSLGTIPVGSANFNVGQVHQYVAATDGTGVIRKGGIQDDDLLAITIEGVPNQATNAIVFSASKIGDYNAGDTQPLEARAIDDATAVVGFVPIFLAWDDDDQLVFTSSSASNDPSPLTLWRFGRATAVEPNPDGSDGPTLSRLRVQGRNYALPSSGYLFYIRPVLAIPADVTAAQQVGLGGLSYTILDELTVRDRVYADIDFATEWFGYFTINGDWDGSGLGAIRNLVVDLQTLHNFNGKTISTTRQVGIPWRKQTDTGFRLHGLDSITSIRTGSYRPPGGNSDGSEDVEITEADLLGPVSISYTLTIRGVDGSGNFDPFTLDTLDWHNIQTRSYQIDHSGSSISVGTHNRYIGWSTTQSPTLVEFNAGSAQDDDTLTIPARSANGYVWFAVPKRQGQPTGLTVPNNPINVLGDFRRLTDRDFGGESHYVYISRVAQNADIIGDGTYVYTLSYGAS